MKKVKQLVCAALSLILVTGCSAGSASQNSEAVFKSGTYEASSAGRNGDVKLTVTFSDSKIEKIETENEETSGIGDVAIEELINTVISTQSVPDAVTGATISSNAFIEAFKDTVKQAGADPDALKGTETAKEETSYKTEADIIVIGAGAAGMSAAITASEKGKSVILLEKSTTTGGNTPAAANGINAADTDVQLKNEDYVNAGASVKGLEELQLQNSEARENLVDAFAEKSKEVIEWFEKMGVEYEVDISKDDRNTLQNYYMLQAKKDGSTGITMINALTKELKKTDVQLYTEMDAYKLVQDETGKVTGVVAKNISGKDITFNGDSVLIATGGFGHNNELIAKYNEKLANCTTDEIAPTTGEGLEMALAVGAKAVDLKEIQTFPVVAEGYGMVTPNKLPGGFQVSAIIVNDNAERFTKEGFEIGDEILAQPNGHAYMIFDESQLNDDLKLMVEGGYIKEADTAEELAEELDLDPAKLSLTVKNYNDDIADGNDDAFGKENPVKLEGKLYGFRYGVGAHYFMGGILINEKTQVLDENEEPIEGLYAAGEVTGGFHGTQRIDGSGLGDSFVFGKIAGEELSK